MKRQKDAPPDDEADGANQQAPENNTATLPEQQPPIPVTLSPIEREKLRVHEIAELFPKMEDNAYWELRADLTANGMSVPMLVSKDHRRLLDGRHRKRACDEVPRIKPLFVEFQGEPEQEADIIASLNLHRRHLNTKKRAELAAKLVPELRRAQIEQEQPTENKTSKKVLSGTRAPKGSGSVVDKAAQLMHVSKSSVEREIRRTGQQAVPRKSKTKAPKTEKPFDDQVYKKWTQWMNNFPPQQRSELLPQFGEWIDWLNRLPDAQRFDTFQFIQKWMQWLKRCFPQAQHNKVMQLVQNWTKPNEITAATGHAPNDEDGK